MNNLTLYNQVRTVPPTALKEIKGGRLNGKTDINPMWRIKTLTEQFGPCGIGWKYAITKQWLETGGKDEIAAFVNIDLYVKHSGEWSEAIPGTGGSMFVANENRGPYVSDECYKMALTDAISVACKALGFGADVYWDKDATKYNRLAQQPQQGGPKPALQQIQQPKNTTTATNKPSGPKEQPINWKGFWAKAKSIGYTQEQVHAYAKTESLADWTRSALNALLADLEAVKKEEMQSA